MPPVRRVQDYFVSVVYREPASAVLTDASNQMDLHPEGPFVEFNARCAPHRTTFGSRAIVTEGIHHCWMVLKRRVTLAHLTCNRWRLSSKSPLLIVALFYCMVSRLVLIQLFRTNDLRAA